MAAGGQKILTRPFQLVSGHTWNSTAFGGAALRLVFKCAVRRVICTSIVNQLNRLLLVAIEAIVIMGKTGSKLRTPHTLPFEKMAEGFDLMDAGKW